MPIKFSIQPGAVVNVYEAPPHPVPSPTDLEQFELSTETTVNVVLSNGERAESRLVDEADVGDFVDALREAGPGLDITIKGKGE